MDLVIQELDTNTLEHINQCDNTFRVDAKLDVHAESSDIRYTLVSLPFSSRKLQLQMSLPSGQIY